MTDICLDQTLGQLGQCLDVWEAGQRGLPNVVRYAKYGVPDYGGVERQDSLQHTYSIGVLATIMMIRFPLHVELDESILHIAFQVHDHGEAELLNDTHYIDKSPEGDLNEYRAFCQRYEQLGSSVFARFQQAFLLQFARTNPDCFPDSARQIMRFLQRNRPTEVMFFEAMERTDYWFYPLQQYRKRGNAQILVQVIRNQFDHLCRLAKTLPGLSAEVWTPLIQDEMRLLLSKHEGQWIETRSA